MARGGAIDHQGVRAIYKDIDSALRIGDRLGPYEILSVLGTGGMGEVYRARDTHLGRVVALKTLPGDVIGDDTGRVRLEREARALASLNHPNIVTIHSVDRAGDRLFLTMEFVPGQPLSAMIPANGLPLDRLLAIAIPVTEAVTSAHASGILHRDLKPANIMVTPDGAVKVLDFGLAKNRDASVAGDGTVTMTALTDAGQVVGTVAYMSPEQAEGKAVDQRSDIFSLGVVLYEMATGTRPFRGDTPLSTLTAILRDTPIPAPALNPAVPPELARVIRRALAKDPERRQQTVKDLRNDLDELRQDLLAGGTSPAGTSRSTAPRRYGVALALAAIAAAAITAMVWPGSAPAIDTTASAGRASALAITSVTTEDGLEMFPSLSPDGKWVVYTQDEHGTGQTDIFLRAVGALTAINLTQDSNADDLQPVFSPDGERVAFRSERDGGGLFVMGRTGDSVRRLTTEGFNPSWSPDGASIVYGRESVTTLPNVRVGQSPAMGVVATATGVRRELKLADAVQPSWSPLGRRIAFWAITREGQRDIWTIAATGGEPVAVTNDPAVDWNPVWAPDGRHLYYSSNRSGSYSLWRVAIDEASGRTLADPEAVSLPRAGVAHFSFAGDGTRIAMASLATQANVEAVAFDPGTLETGRRRRLTNRSESGIASVGSDSPAVSADGEWLVFNMISVTGRSDLWAVRTDGTGLRQVTDDAYRDVNPRWFPDGKHIMFRSDRSGRFQVWTAAADGGSLTQVTELPDPVGALALSQDGSRGIATTTGTMIMFDPRVAAADQRLEELPRPSFFPTSWSSDGSRIGGFLGGSIGTYTLSSRHYESLAEAGHSPHWLPDNRTLLYTTGRDLRTFDTVTKLSKVVLAAPTEMLSGPVFSPRRGEIYLVMVKRQGDIILADLSGGAS